MWCGVETLRHIVDVGEFAAGNPLEVLFDGAGVAELRVIVSIQELFDLISGDCRFLIREIDRIQSP